MRRVQARLKFVKEVGRRIRECPFVYEGAGCTGLKVSIRLIFCLGNLEIIGHRD